MGDFGLTEFAAIGSILGSAASVGKMLFSQNPSSAATPAPTLAPPTAMPTPDDDAARAAKRRELAGEATRRGRQSTILSDDTNNDVLGG